MRRSSLLQSPARSALFAVTALTAAVLTLAGCGGGGGGSSSAPVVQPATTVPGPKAAAASMYFTDDFSALYDAVWIGVSKVVAVNAAGTETELIAYAPSKRLNVSTLRQAGTWASGVQVPADAVGVRVYADTNAQLQQLDGSMLNVTLNLTGGYLAFKLDTWDRNSGVLALDFDLPRFTLQGTTLTPATRVAGNAEYAGWNHRDAEIKGKVSAVTATSLTIDGGILGSRVVVLDANTSFVSAVNATWMPAVGDTVEVDSIVSGQGTDVKFTARVVKQRSATGMGDSTEVKGNVTAVKGSVVTLSISSSGDTGPTGVVDIDLAKATFKRGSLAAVTPGVNIEVFLMPAGAGWSAVVVEVDGAAKAGQDVRRDYAEVKGRVVTVSGTQVTLTPTYTERYGAVLPAGNLTVDLATATFEKSALSCLVAGSPIDVKGYLDKAGVFQVTRVDAEGACSAAVPASGVAVTTDTSSDSSRMDGMMVDVKGTITAVRAGEVDVSVFSLEGLASTASAMTVRLAPGTYFKGLSAATLAVGQFVEIKGTLQAGVLNATKMERD